jgi:WD40 repeat protein
LLASDYKHQPAKIIMIHRSEFLKDFRLQVTTEFHSDGQDAQWASASGPRFWGGEDKTIELDTSDRPEFGHARSAMAVSSDGILLAVAWSSVIKILDLGTGKVLSELKGHPNSVGKLVFAPSVHASLCVSRWRWARTACDCLESGQ